MRYTCSSCPRRCGAVRAETGQGYCRMPADAVVARAALHFDEEPVVSGARGSGAVFFSGCALRCVFCQNYGISHDGYGNKCSVSGLKKMYRALIDQGAHNVNLVNPTHFLEPILSSLDEDPGVPVIWNTGGYERVESLQRLEGKVSVFLPDLKYVSAGLSKKYSGAADYFEVAQRALKAMLKIAGPVRLDADGLIASGVIVRHLILPGCAEDSMRALDWFAENMPGAYLSLMAQYVPMGEMASRKGDALSRRLTKREYERVAGHMLALGIEDGFVQELESGDEKYVPAFDLTGVIED